jgi:hypothetical protein
MWSLLAEFMDLPLPKLFLYGKQNRNLSYLDRLFVSDVTVREISSSANFLFYENPVETFSAIAEFIDSNSCGTDDRLLQF